MIQNEARISSIIFDLGGVILDIDYELTTKAFIDLGLKNFRDVYSQKKQRRFFDDFEKGNLSRKQFFEEVRTHLPEGITDMRIEEAWNAMLMHIPAERIEWLREVNSRYRTFLLSNTNEIHIQAFRKILQDDFGNDVLKEHFEKCYYSSEIGMRKPDLEIFRHVISENELEPSTTLFIDDSPQHVEGALAAGLNAELLQEGVAVEDQFSYLLD